MSLTAEKLPPDFIERLSEANLPVVANVLRELRKVLDTPISSAAELAEVILNDASLTSKVLKISNSVYYNPTNLPIGTVSRAVVQLGIAQIKSICVSAIVLDGFKSKRSNPELLAAIADSVHIAMQARGFYRLSNQDDIEPEEVLVAGLLRKLGELAFWADENIDQQTLDALRQIDNLAKKSNQRKILGMSFDDITSRLCEKWSLGDVLSESLEINMANKIPSAGAVALGFGNKMVIALNSNTEKEELDSLVQSIAKHYETSVEGIMSLVVESTKEAMKLAASHGVDDICGRIEDSQNKCAVFERVKVDAGLHAEVTQELISMTEQKVDINTLFHTVLEGLHRAAGFERVAIALLDKPHQHLQAKYIIGSKAFPWERKFKLSLNENNAVFKRCVKDRRTIVADESEIKASTLGFAAGAMLAPIIVGDKLLGVYYADCGDKPTVDDDRQHGFSELCSLSNKSLSAIVSKR